MSSTQALLPLAAKHDYVVHQMDVKSAYLYGRLEKDKEIYLRPPQGVELIGIKPGQVLKLKACLYGLKQAGRHWAIKLRAVMNTVSLTRSGHDHAVFYRHHADGHVTVIEAYVDDMTLLALTGSDL